MARQCHWSNALTISTHRLVPIPSSFFLFGQEIVVEYTDRLIDNEDAVGMSLYRRNIIQIQKNNQGIVRPQTQIESTFFHELMHYVFFMLGKEDLRKDEDLVDVIGRLLHQAFMTAEYNEEILEGKKNE